MPAPSSFTDRVIIVTGAGSGIGRAYAQLLASLGARVLVNNRHRSADAVPSAERVARQLREAGADALADTSDIATPQGADQLAAQALARWGRIDALICNAGFTRDRTFLKMGLEDFRAVVDVHLMGTVYCCHAVLPGMVESGSGRILCSISSAGLHGNFGQTNYAAAKAGLIGFMRSLDLEVRKHGVRVNAISPFAATNMTKGGSMDQQADGRFHPDRVAAAAAYLVSAACDFGGEIITAGGGYYGTAAMVEGDGVRLPADDRAPAITDIAARIDDIRSLRRWQRFEDARQSADHVLRARRPDAGGRPA